VIARSLTNAFAGIRPLDLPGFITALLHGLPRGRPFGLPVTARVIFGHPFAEGSAKWTSSAHGLTTRSSISPSFRIGPDGKSTHDRLGLITSRQAELYAPD
jgi:hypothetical protein